MSLVFLYMHIIGVVRTTVNAWNPMGFANVSINGSAEIAVSRLMSGRSLYRKR
jgi:hypothetical protein